VPTAAPPATATRLRVPVALAALAVLLQVAYPLVTGDLRDRLTVVTVLVFCAACTTHALLTRGPRWAALLVLVTAGAGFTAEAVGVATGMPFGDYSYAGSLGWRLLGVPLVVPLAWTMAAYPALLVGRRLGHPVLAGAWALASWDLFLDPQMVAAGHWRWEDVQHSLPGVPGIPVSNLLGWLGVALLVMALLSRLPDRAADDRVPTALFVWTYASCVLANLAFFDRPGVAVVGGVAMGLVAVPLVRDLSR
jgi:putative membrane protein